VSRVKGHGSRSVHPKACTGGDFRKGTTDSGYTNLFLNYDIVDSGKKFQIFKGFPKEPVASSRYGYKDNVIG